MSDPFVPIVENQPVHEASVTSTAATKDAITAGAAAQANSAPNSSTKIGDIGELKAKAPEIWEKYLESLGMSMCRRMQRQNDRIRKMMRESNEIA